MTAAWAKSGRVQGHIYVCGGSSLGLSPPKTTVITGSQSAMDEVMTKTF